MEEPWWSISCNNFLSDFRSGFAIISLVGIFRKWPEFFVFFAWIFYVLLCPFTKVEESFNVQATHDILYHFLDIDKYDHLEFPGVVPRTFTGPIFLAVTSWPFVRIVKFFHLPKFYSLLIVRSLLACSIFFCFRRFIKSVRRSFGRTVAFLLCLLTLTQFHFNFYISRPLPNVFALGLVLLVYSFWLNGEYKRSIWLAVFSALIFRCELILLYAPMYLPLLFKKRISFSEAIFHGLAAAVVVLAVTVPIDSWFWRRWLWPEGEVWLYNVIMNKSSNWGTSPLMWYFYSVLPRALLLSVFLAPLGAFFDGRIRTILAPVLFFISMYSLLPHKELRFIIYTFPLFNLASAVACDRIFNNWRKSWLQRFLCFGVISHFVINIYLTSIFARAAYGNYPGASVLYNLHATEKPTRHLRLHVDTYCAQTGISRFLHENDLWEYNKSETLAAGSREMRSFDYLLIGGEDMGNLTATIRMYSDTHEVVKEILAFHRISPFFSFKQPPFLKRPEFIWAKRVCMLRKKNF